MKYLLRATIHHAPTPDRLITHEDGGLLVEDGRILACGPYLPDTEAVTRDLRPWLLIPGLIDTHVHFPQMRIMGCLGRTLLDWLALHTLPEEARLEDVTYARLIASEFTQALARNGTTTALVFGSHFPAATAELFEAAATAGLRIFSGLVLADRGLLPSLHQTPDAAYRASKDLIRRYPNYVISPRFALATSVGLLSVCQALLREHPGLRCQTHINENRDEVKQVGSLFPGDMDYLSIYERFDLVNRRTVLAHNLHTTGGEIKRLAGRGATVAHCPSSNAALGSGIFPYRRHREAGVRVSLGTDVGAGIGFSLLREALQAHLFQRVAPEPVTLSAAEMLYLATKAGAEALDIGDEAGDLTPGKSADFVALDAPHLSLAGPEHIREVAVAGRVVYQR